MRDYPGFCGYSGWALIVTERVLISGRQGGVLGEESSDVMMESLIGVMQPGAKKCWLPLQAGGCKERVIPWGF